MDSDFETAVIRCLNQIPRGRVATCGAIARALGDGRAARAVATWITGHPETQRAHRVVRVDGRPLVDGAQDRLRRDGVSVVRGRVESPRILGSLREVELLRELREEQRRLAATVIERDEVGPIKVVAGVDVSYRDDEMCAAAASVAIDDLRCVEIVMARRRVHFPYIPTYLAYREFPGIQAAVRGLSTRPDVLMIDGHGRLHPALFGVACFAGVTLDMPTIGIAKNPLAGRRRMAGPRDHDATPLWIGDTIRGFAWLPPGRSRPIYVSVGHRISLQSALNLVRETTHRGYPEALRIADRVSRENEEE
ncbi:MAG: endonuclease V [Thermoplasmata archaeon]